VKMKGKVVEVAATGVVMVKEVVVASQQQL
jgi:hypothetical protein